MPDQTNRLVQRLADLPREHVTDVHADHRSGLVERIERRADSIVQNRAGRVEPCEKVREGMHDGLKLGLRLLKLSLLLFEPHAEAGTITLSLHVGRIRAIDKLSPAARPRDCLRIEALTLLLQQPVLLTHPTGDRGRSLPRASVPATPFGPAFLRERSQQRQGTAISLTSTGSPSGAGGARSFLGVL